jgi:hypothetical protein
VALSGEQRFARSSAVGRYWLARCEGFRALSGSRDVGTIEQVRCTPRQGDAYSLVIKGHGRRVSVPVDRVLEVDPWTEAIVLAPSRRLRDQLSRSAAAATMVSKAARLTVSGFRRYMPVVIEGSRAAVTATERTSRGALRWTSPRARRGLVAVLRAAAAILVLVATVVADALDWLRPRVRTLATGAWRLAHRARSRAADRFTSARRPA